MDISLEKIDLIRERTGVSYSEAKAALEKANGDVIEALIQLEKGERTWKEQIQVNGRELVDKVKEIIHEGNVTKVKVIHEGRPILEIPVTWGAVGVLLMPTIAALGVVAAMVARCTIEVERRSDNGSSED